MHFNIFTWPPVIAGILNFGLCALALWRSPRQPVHRAFAAWNFCMGMWNVNIFLLYTVADASRALELTRWTRDYMVFIHAIFFHFVLLFTQDHKRLNRRLLGAAYAAGCLFLVANHLHNALFIRSLQRFYWGYYPEAGPIAILFALCFNAVIMYAMVLLRAAGRVTEGFRRNQYQLIFVATLLVFGSAMSNFLVALGVKVYPFGNVINIVYSLLIAYAVETYALMDIQMVIRKSFVYLSLGGALSITYLFLVSLIRYMFLEHDSWSAEYAFHVAALPITLAFAPRVKSWIEPHIQGAPLWQKRNNHISIQEFNQTILTLLELDELTTSLVEQASRFLGTEEVVLYLESDLPNHLKKRASVGIEAASEIIVSSEVMHWVLKKRQVVLSERILWEAEDLNRAGWPPAIVKFAKELPYPLIAPLLFRDHFIGLLCLGSKRSKTIYTREDLQLLKTLVGQMAVALSNAQALEQVEEKEQQLKRQREMAIIGTFATEMAHELNKPLTHIMNEGSRLEQSVHGSSRKSLEKIGKEAQRASEILDGFSMLSPGRTLHRIPYAVKDLLEEALSALGVEDSEHIRVIRHYEDLPRILLNPGQIAQVLTNVIQNALQSMSEIGVLTLSLGRDLFLTTPTVAITVTDTGPGIPREIQSKVYDPFFTTKSEQGGRGVGLTISRAMIERHGGTITIKSPITKDGGTRVTVHIPIGEEDSNET